jgi:gliding motility-associated-like protein
VLLNATTAGAQGYLWSTGATTPTITVSVPGTYGVTVTGICGSAVDQVLIGPCIPPLNVSLGNNLSICPGETAILQANATGGLPPYIINWSPNVGSGAGPFTVTPASSAAYTAIVTDAQGSVASATLEILVEVPFGSISLGADSVLCNGRTLQLNATAPGAQSYLWNNGSTMAQITVSTPGFYTVQFSGSCFTESASIQIVDGEPQVSPFQNELRFCRGDSVLAGPSVPNVMQAIWNDGVVNTPRYFTDEGLYTIALQSICGERFLNVDVQTLNCECDVYVPNAFSPDADGLNDLFGPVVNCDVKRFEFSVFNRQGERVFHTNRVDSKWDGSNSGDSFYGENTLYVWQLVLEPNVNVRVPETIRRSGSVMLLR